MNSIKPKKGKCIDCPPDAWEQPLIAGRCNQHYWKHRHNVNLSKPTFQYKAPKVDKYEQKKTLGRWFNEKINQMPRCCENCGERLISFSSWSLRGYVAHVVPKRHFESVQTHPMNCMYLCIDCHTNYDNWLSVEIKEKMPKVYEMAVERFFCFMHNIHPSEVRHLQPFLEDIYFSAV